jgi:hypothetical protein
MIASATKQLQALEGLSAKLRFAVSYFREQKEGGEPFPGDEKLKEAGLI